MRWRLLFLALVVGNILFGIFWLWKSRPATPATNIVVPDIDEALQTQRVKTNVVVRRQNFTWQEVESDNYLTYIKNLREIGCPSSTIRDIIVADVNALFAHRRASEIVSADHQWWRSEPDLDAIQQAADKVKSLETERRALLARLLGENWETANSAVPPAVRTGVSLTGPVLGEMPAATKQAVYDISAATQQRLEAYVEAQQKSGAPVDPQTLALIRRESRAELAKVLNAEQLEEFLLRYSTTGYELREQLRGLNLSPEEFRAAFRARDPFEQDLERHYSGTEPARSLRKQELDAQAEQALRQSLGEKNYAQLQLLRDPIYRISQAETEELGAPPEFVMPVYEIKRLTETEVARIQADPTLSEDEQVERVALARAEEDKALRKILPPEVLQRLQNDRTEP